MAPNKEAVTRPKHGRLVNLCMMGSIVAIVCAVAIMMIPDPIDPVAYELPPPPSLTGPLAQNEELKMSKRILKSLKGPESMVIYDDHLYTGTLDGAIMKINRQGEASVLAMLGTGSNMTTRGRPLGIRLDSTKKYLYVVDAYLGLYKVEISTGIYEKVFPFVDHVDVTFFDDLDFLPNGDIVVSEASTKYHYDASMYEVLESSGTGRLLRISPKMHRYEVIRTGLFFPNGVQRDLRNEDAVLVGETIRDRIIRVFVNGEKKGHFEVFADNLPGTVDNIRSSEKGDGYWVALGAIRSEAFDSKVHQFSRWPSIRLLLAKLLPQPLLLSLSVDVRYSLVIKLDLDGRIVESLHDTNGSVLPLTTQITEHSGSLYIGNFNSDGIAYLDRNCKENNTCFFKEP